MGELISVIIPCYEQARYLPDAINSVLNQSYRNIEVVIVNDGSEDETKEVALSYGSRIVYVEQRNGGPAAARNSGIRRSRGAWIQFLDADDLLVSDKIEKQIVDLGTHNVRCGYCATAMFNEGRKREITGVIWPGAIDNMYLRLISMWKEYPIPIHSLLLAKTIFEEYGLFPEDMRANEDRLFLTNIALAGERFRFTPFLGAFYRRHHSNTSCDDEIGLRAHCRYVKRVWEDAQRMGMVSEEVCDAVMRSALHVIVVWRRKGFAWRSLRPLMDVYLDSFMFQIWQRSGVSFVRKRQLRRVLRMTQQARIEMYLVWSKVRGRKTKKVGLRRQAGAF